jgi:hypothetical protein
MGVFEVQVPHPPRRTLVVLGSLMAAMTLASAVLLALQPAPIMPVSHLHLLSTERAYDPADALFETLVPVLPGRWERIAVSFSGHRFGSSQTVGMQHEGLGLGGLGHHFVIGNGTGSADGRIDVGFRWQHQQSGRVPWHVQPRPGSAEARTLYVCVIGDGRESGPTRNQLRELTWLVRLLQARLEIASEQVELVDLGPYTVGPRFPVIELRQQLLP